MLGGADNANGELPSYITGANKCASSSLRSNSVLHSCGSSRAADDGGHAENPAGAS